MKEIIKKWDSISLVKRIICGLIVGIVLGIAVAACSLRDFLRLTERKARESERKEKWH